MRVRPTISLSCPANSSAMPRAMVVTLIDSAAVLGDMSNSRENPGSSGCVQYSSPNDEKEPANRAAETRRSAASPCR